MAINLNNINVINVNDGINVNNVHFNLYNTYALIMIANSLNLLSSNTNITLHVQTAFRGITLNLATLIPLFPWSNSPPIVKPPKTYLDTMICTIRYKIWYNSASVVKHCFCGSAPTCLSHIQITILSGVCLSQLIHTWISHRYVPTYVPM
jgi:hypothetical protein